MFNWIGFIAAIIVIVLYDFAILPAIGIAILACAIGGQLDRVLIRYGAPSFRWRHRF